MNLNERVSALARLGDILTLKLTEGALDRYLDEAYHKNQWFTRSQTRHALTAIIDTHLSHKALEKWTAAYELPAQPDRVKTVGLVMAGNIPLAGWHDMMAVWITGHKALVKPSSKDGVLPKMMIQELLAIEARFGDLIQTTDGMLKDFDAIIATGSNNTMRYFEYYFEKYPHILRKNRNSVAVLTGKETSAQLAALGDDIFSYFGFGCRNVSAMLVPEGYNFTAFFEAIEDRNEILDHFKYTNNYTYNKSLLLLNKEPHLDNGFLLLKSSEAFASPVSVLHYQYYSTPEQAADIIKTGMDDLQCVVSLPGLFEQSVDFGQTQHPELWDYADGVDTLDFLLKLDNQ